METLLKTPLFDAYEKWGGKIVDFAGWALPVQFEGINIEHQAVRKQAGLFDVSHMGEIQVKGAGALDFIQNLITNDAEVLEDNQILYTFMCYESGGVVDDLLVYRFSKDYFYLVVNASNSDKDYEWMQKNSNGYEVTLENISKQVGELALQGPKAQEILQKLTDTDLSQIKFFYCKRDVNIKGCKCLVSRTGYTGEDGFEVYTAPENILILWDSILESGKEEGIKPAGLGCRDTLRFEACLPLYGNEISDSITPLEAALGFFVKLNKNNFIGKEALMAQKSEGLKRKLVGFEMLDKGIPRHGYGVVVGEENIGFVTTGYHSPSLNRNIGLALVDIKYSDLDSEFNIVIRGKSLKAKVVNKKFYNKNYKK